MPRHREKKHFWILALTLLTLVSNAEPHSGSQAPRAEVDNSQLCEKQWSEEALLAALQKRNNLLPDAMLKGLFGKSEKENPLAADETAPQTNLEVDNEALRGLVLESLSCSSSSPHNNSLFALLTQAVMGENSSEELKSLRQIYPPLRLMNELGSDWKKALLLQAKEFSEKGMQANLLESLKNLIDDARKYKSAEPELFDKLYLLFEHPLMNLMVGADLRKALVRRLTEIPPEKTELQTGTENLGSPPPATSKAVTAIKKELAALQSSDPKKRVEAVREFQEAISNLSGLSAAEKAPIKSWLRELSSQIQQGQVASKDERERNLLQDRLDEVYRAMDEGDTTLHEEARTWKTLNDTKRSAIEGLEKYLHESGNGELLGVNIGQLAQLTESELGTLLDYAKKSSAANDSHLKVLLMESRAEDIKAYLKAREELWFKNRDPESQAFISMMDRYFHDVLNASMTLQNESDLLELSSHQKLQLSRLLAGIPPQDPDSVALARSLLFGPGVMDQRLAYFSKRMDPEFSKYPPRSEQPEILKSPSGKELEKKVAEALASESSRHVLTAPEEWVQEILKKPESQRTKTEAEAVQTFLELDEIRSQRKTLQEESELKAARLDPRIRAFERELQGYLNKEQRMDLSAEERASLPAGKQRVQEEIEKLKAEQELLRAFSEQDHELGQEERAALEGVKSLQREKLYQLGDSGEALDAINYLIEEATRGKMLPLVAARPGTSNGFGAAEVLVQSWFEKEKAKTQDPAQVDRLLAQEMEKRKKREAERAPHIKKLNAMGVKAVGGGLHIDFSQAKVKDPQELYQALDKLDPSLRKDFEAWARRTYLASGAPRDSLVALNEHLAIQGSESGKDLKIVPVTKELRAELQKEVDELRRLVIDEPHLIKKAASFLQNAAAGLSRADAVLARQWLGLDTSHWESSLMGKLVGAEEDQTGHITTLAQRKLEKSQDRFRELLQSIQKKGNLLASYPSHEVAGRSHQVPASQLAQYFSDKQREYARYQGLQLKALDADLASLEETMRFTRDTAAITVGTFGVGSLLGAAARGVGAVQTANRIARMQALAKGIAIRQAPAVGNALTRGYALSGATQTLGGAYHYMAADESQMAQAVKAYEEAVKKGEKPPKLAPNLDLDNDGVPDGLQGHGVSFLNSLPNFERYNQSAQSLSLFLYGQGQLMGHAQRFLPSNPLIAQMAANVTMSTGQGVGEKIYYNATGKPDLAPALSDIGWSVANNLVWASPVDDAAVAFLSRFKGFNQLSLGAQRQVARALGVGTNMGWSGGIGAAQELFTKEGFLGTTGQEANGAWDAFAMSLVESLAGDTYAGFRSAQSAHAMGLAHVARRNPEEALRHLEEIKADEGSRLSSDLITQLPVHLFPGRYQGDAGLSPKHEELIHAQAELYARIHDLDPAQLESRMKQAKRSEPLQNIIYKMKAEKASQGANGSSP